MCGITGFLETTPRRGTDALEPVITRMADTLRHRGPDDGGSWTRGESGIALGFRRLAILDLSRDGRQPMTSGNGRYTVVFNGEIYNFSALRKELRERGHTFRGGSDTEVLLASLVEWGLGDALTRLNGMFAMGVWDRDRAELTLVRDRLGKKPLYYGWSGETFLFGSELKSLRAHGALRAEIDREALAAYFRRGYFPAPQTVYRAVRQLQPGTFLRVSAARRRAAPEVYWSLKEVARSGAADEFAGTADEALDELDELLREAASLRMVADVPVGVLLSGGTDSALIASLMQAQSATPVRTFTVGFDETGFDEAPAARRAAEFLGTDHTEMYVSSADAREVIPHLPGMYDEPFADSSQIPTHLISEVARREVTVCLTGDGGDELFGGYRRYALAEMLSGRIARIPPAVRPAVARATALAATALGLAREGGRQARATPLGDRSARLARLLRDTVPGSSLRPPHLILGSRRAGCGRRCG